MSSETESPLVMRATDQETARVVAVHRGDGAIVGAACLLDSQYVITCQHVVLAAINDFTKAAEGAMVLVSLPGVTGQPTMEAKVVRPGGNETQNDLALLQILEGQALLRVPPVEFASPLRHGGKTYSVLGFPDGDRQGRNVIGVLHAADTKGLVQMDRGGALSVLGGFSGAPVYSADLNAFVGLVVTELSNHSVSWCIPSRRLCEFYPELRVRFRIPPKDRPRIHDRHEDDPNLELFGQIAENRERRLLATVKEHRDHYTVNVSLQCKPGSPDPRGHYATFITYPDFEEEGEDAYELFAEFEMFGPAWVAEQEFYPDELFTVAAVCDAGDSVLTLNLEEVPLTKRKPRRLTKRRGSKRRK